MSNCEDGPGGSGIVENIKNESVACAMINLDEIVVLGKLVRKNQYSYVKSKKKEA